MVLTTLQKRMILFLVGCIGVRSYLVYLAKTVKPNNLKLMGYLALLPAIGFTYIYLTGSRKTGPEVFGDKIWWNDLRPIHAMMYFIFAYLAIQGKEYAWKILLADVLLGLTAFLVHHFG